MNKTIPDVEFLAKEPKNNELTIAPKVRECQTKKKIFSCNSDEIMAWPLQTFLSSFI